MSLVIDCSVAAAWLMPDEQSLEADQAIHLALKEGVDVPVLFLSEVANVLVMSARRGRIPSPLPLLADLTPLNLRLDAGAAVERTAQVIALAERHRLTAYDATYLELARRLGARLATLDGDLRRAAGEAGVSLLLE